MVLFVVFYGVFKKINVYDTFIEGAEESIGISLKLFPTLIAMILGINIFLNSGILTSFFNLIKPLFNLINVPVDILPMMIMRPISGSSTLAMLNHILNSNGADSLISNLACVIQGSTDTTFYVISLYFGSIGIKKIRYALWAGLFADLIGIIASLVIVNIFW